MFQSNSTTLHIAATNNQDHVAKLLLDTHKCNYHLKNKVRIPNSFQHNPNF